METYTLEGLLLWTSTREILKKTQRFDSASTHQGITMKLSQLLKGKKIILYTAIIVAPLLYRLYRRKMAEDGKAVSATVKSIFVYPIKSCRGISVPQAPISATLGSAMARGERQRNEPKLALVRVELPSGAFLADWQPNKHSYLVIHAPGMEVLRIPLVKPFQKVDGVSVWEWSGSAVDEGAVAAQWLSDYIGKPARLARFNDASEVRKVDPDYANGYKVMFADGYPFLLLSQGSLNALNALLKEPVPVNRFRPNILVDGCEPFSEDKWTEIKISKLTFKGVKLCTRCKVPTIDQETAAMNSEPTETLTKFRSDKVLRTDKKQQKGKVYFGLNMVCADCLRDGKGKSIKVGDPIFVFKMVAYAPD